jgi:hypothetical protein
MSKPLGRKSKFTAALTRRFCGFIARRGLTIKEAAAQCGIAERTVYEWIEKHPQFSQAVTRAIGQSKIFLVEKLRESTDWRAAAFLLPTPARGLWPRDGSPAGGGATAPLPLRITINA